jgi:hypothetical protein
MSAKLASENPTGSLKDRSPGRHLSGEQDSRPKPGDTVIDELEACELDHPAELGSWSYTPGGPNGRELALTYTTFLPNIAFDAGLLANVCTHAGHRARWASRVVTTDP